MKRDVMQERSSIPGPAAATALLVEPDRRARGQIAGWLRDAGYGIQEAESFEQARARLQAAPPDVLVAGLRLGAFNGLHLIITARAARPELRAVLLTSTEDAGLAAEALRSDAVYLVKPILRDAFLAAVAKIS
jgi:DNA-binding NtrC family response regulator